jgi:hypothetical protein
MSISFSRRSFLNLTPVFLLAPSGAVAQGRAAVPTESGSFPIQDRELVRETVGVSHGNLARVKELVSARPALARASWDWGFGDHESAIDAASHVGNRPIAEFLIANGARPTMFTAAMLGQLSVVRGMIEALPGVQRMRGPHGITLLSHAKAGGAAAAEVVAYLERLGDADQRYANLPLSASEQAALPGDYAFGSGTNELLRIAKNARGDLTISRPGVINERTLQHQGGLVFNPPGAEAVKVRFELAADRGVALTVEDGPSIVKALRTP